MVWIWALGCVAVALPLDPYKPPGARHSLVHLLLFAP